MKPLLRAVLVASVLVAVVRPGSAADWPDGTVATLPCRPTVACTADMVRPGALEIESGLLFRKLGGDVREWTYPVLLKLTLDDAIQLQAGSNGLTVVHRASPALFFDDALLGVKAHVLQQTAMQPSISVSATASVPTVRGQEGYLRTYDALFTSYVTKDVGPVHADLNLGFNLWRVGDAPLPQEWTALALSMNLPRPFGVMAEAYYFSDAAPVAPRDGGFLFALSHAPEPWLVFDIGADAGWFPSSRSYSVFFGMTIVPVVLWRRVPPPSPPTN